MRAYSLQLACLASHYIYLFCSRSLDSFALRIRLQMSQLLPAMCDVTIPSNVRLACWPCCSLCAFVLIMTCVVTVTAQLVSVNSFAPGIVFSSPTPTASVGALVSSTPTPTPLALPKRSSVVKWFETNAVYVGAIGGGGLLLIIIIAAVFWYRVQRKASRVAKLVRVRALVWIVGPHYTHSFDMRRLVARLLPPAQARAHRSCLRCHSSQLLSIRLSTRIHRQARLGLLGGHLD